MSPTVELGPTVSGGRLGGISTMVTQADICPTCGGRHEVRRRPFWDRSGRTEDGCPIVLSGPFPIVMKLPGDQSVSVEFPFVPDSAARDLPAQGTSPEPQVLARRLSQLPIPWPAPSFDEAYL